MPFHIEVSSAFGRARSFNVEAEELRRGLLDPWVAGLPCEFGGRSWQPQESRLAIFEGPRLGAAEDDPEAAWLAALQSSEDVTRRLLEAAERLAPEQKALALEADSLPAALKGLRSGREPRPLQWAHALERLNARDPEIAGLILVLRRSP